MNRKRLRAVVFSALAMVAVTALGSTAVSAQPTQAAVPAIQTDACAPFFLALGLSGVVLSPHGLPAECTTSTTGPPITFPPITTAPPTTKAVPTTTIPFDVLPTTTSTVKTEVLPAVEVAKPAAAVSGDPTFTG